MGWSIHGRQAGAGQREDTVRIVVDRFRRGDLLGFVEHAILER